MLIIQSLVVRYQRESRLYRIEQRWSEIAGARSVQCVGIYQLRCADRERDLVEIWYCVYDKY